MGVVAHDGPVGQRHPPGAALDARRLAGQGARARPGAAVDVGPGIAWVVQDRQDASVPQRFPEQLAVAGLAPQALGEQQAVPGEDVSVALALVNTRLLVEEKHGVTLVPNAAVQRNASKTFLYLVKPDQIVSIRNITVGTSTAEESEIVSGVSPGDVVVTQGSDKLQDGVRVAAQLQDE